MRLLLFFWCSFFLQTIHRCFNFAQFRRVAFNNLALLAFLHVDICSRRRFVLDYSPQNRWRITYMRTQTVIYVIITSITQPVMTLISNTAQYHTIIDTHRRRSNSSTCSTKRTCNCYLHTCTTPDLSDELTIHTELKPDSSVNQHSNPIRSLFTLIGKLHKSVPPPKFNVAKNKRQQKSKTNWRRESNRRQTTRTQRIRYEPAKGSNETDEPGTKR